MTTATAQPLDGATLSAGTVPFLFGVCRAEALPGPILTRLLIDLGMTSSAARTLLSRLKNRGALSAERSGRSAVYRLAGQMAVDFERVRLGPSPSQWDGNFRTIVYDIGESRRDVKDKVRYAAMTHKFGQLRSGVLISPHDRRRQLEDLLSIELDEGFIALGMLSFDAEVSRRMASRAWDLPSRADFIAEAADRIAKRLTQSAPSDGLEAFRELHRYIMDSLSIRLGDPGLPPSLLPDSWPAARLREALSQLMAVLGPVMGCHIAAVISDSPHAVLVEYRAQSDQTIMDDRVQ